jgi:hypothetical protein
MAQRQVDRLTSFSQLLVSPDEGLFKSRNLLLLNLSIFLIFYVYDVSSFFSTFPHENPGLHVSVYCIVKNSQNKNQKDNLDITNLNLECTF